MPRFVDRSHLFEFYLDKVNPFSFIQIQNLQTEALQLKIKMSEIQKDIFHVHKETNACMANLERLDSMKNKLQVSCIRYTHTHNFQMKLLHFTLFFFFTIDRQRGFTRVRRMGKVDS